MDSGAQQGKQQGKQRDLATPLLSVIICIGWRSVIRFRDT